LRFLFAKQERESHQYLSQRRYKWSLLFLGSRCLFLLPEVAKGWHGPTVHVSVGLILWMSSTRVWQLDYCISFLETLLIQLVRNTQEHKTIHVFYSPGTSRK
jgi:hypothetical protein